MPAVNAMFIRIIFLFSFRSRQMRNYAVGCRAFEPDALRVPRETAQRELAQPHLPFDELPECLVAAPLIVCYYFLNP